MEYTLLYWYWLNEGPKYFFHVSHKSYFYNRLFSELLFIFGSLFTPSDAASLPSCNPVCFSVMDLVFPHSLLRALKEIVPPIFVLFPGALSLHPGCSSVCFIGRMLTAAVQPKPPHTGECIKEKPNHSKYLPLSLPPSLWVSPLRLAESCPCYPSSHTCLTHTEKRQTSAARNEEESQRDRNEHQTESTLNTKQNAK